MDRTLYKSLVRWKTSSTRNPLILQGVRQVGKTYILEYFAKKDFTDYIYVNFEEDRVVHEFFIDNLDPKQILMKLGIYYGQTIHPSQTLIIFDEIQACEDALISLKYFCEKANDYYIAAAGSLLGVMLNATKGFPVGKVDFLYLNPLSFFEFLAALKMHKLLEFVTSIEKFEKLPIPIHKQLLDYLRLYTFIGGMPAVIKSYIENQDFKAVRDTQNAIIDAYLLDFSKHAPKSDIIKIQDVWDSLPRQLSKENKKFMFSAIRNSARAREYEQAIHWLKNAGLVHKACRISKPNRPLKSYADKNIFKLYVVDVGLLGAMSHLSPKMIVHGDKLYTEFKGSITENLVAQLLISSNQQDLFYWTSGNTAEVDFILEREISIYPLEVKSGTSSKQKSLHIYDDRYHPPSLLRSSLLNLKCDGRLCNIPLYMIEQLDNLALE